MTCECYKTYQEGPLPLGGVYVIHNKVNQNFYVGSTNNFRKRWVLHVHLLRSGKHHSPHLQSAWNKYGEESFVFHRLMFIDDRVQRLSLEQHLLNTLPSVYNVSRVAISSSGCVRSPETRAKMALSLQRDPSRIEQIRQLGLRSKSEYHKALIAEAHFGIRPSDATRAKLRASSAKRWARKEERDKLRLAKLGVKLGRRNPSRA
jgi:group I intron endonuclease